MITQIAFVCVFRLYPTFWFYLFVHSDCILHFNYICLCMQTVPDKCLCVWWQTVTQMSYMCLFFQTESYQLLEDLWFNRLCHIICLYLFVYSGALCLLEITSLHNVECSHLPRVTSLAYHIYNVCLPCVFYLTIPSWFIIYCSFLVMLVFLWKWLHLCECDVIGLYYLHKLCCLFVFLDNEWSVTLFMFTCM